MQRKKLYAVLIVLGSGLALASAIALLSVQAASAQCGSQASSCKNCHETQAKDPVNNDGTAWHKDHAFGDFCYICHGGNSQSLDETAAHAGMVNPMSDIQAACAQCHASDLQAKAQVYASALGVQVTTGATASPAAPTSAAPSATPAASAGPAQASLGAAPAAGSSDLVDYVQRYDQNALGQQPLNVGNTILIIMIVVMVLGGGAMVVMREGLVRVSFKETRPVPGEYPRDVVEILPDLAKLKPAARKSLQRVLQKPSAAGNLLEAVEKFMKDEEEDRS